MPKGLLPFPAYLKKAGYYTTNQAKTDYNLVVNMKETWSESSRDASWQNRSPNQPFFHQQTIKISHESSSHFSLRQIQQNPLGDLKESIVLPPHHPGTELFRYAYAHYQQRIKQVDQTIGKLIQELKDDGVWEDTILFYFGDHGGILPRSKGYAYETGMAVPLIVRVPEKWKHLSPFQAGSRSDALVNFYDFGPTLLHLAGIPVPEGADGVPFLGREVSAEKLRDSVSYGYADRFDEKYDMVRTIRIGNYKYIRNLQPFNHDSLFNEYRYRQLAYQELRTQFKNGELNEVQSQFFRAKPAEALFDLESDPYEVRNLANDPKFQKQLKHMRNLLTDHLKSQNDLSFIPESDLVQTAFENPTQFGRTHHTEIARLVDIANLQLRPFDEIESILTDSLDSESRWERYWACIVATSFADDAKSLKKKLRSIAESDPEPLVRVRAAEFLGLTGSQSCIEILTAAALQSTDPVELTLILNSVALIYETDPDKFKFNLSRDQLKLAPNKLIESRLNYFSPRPSSN